MSLSEAGLLVVRSQPEVRSLEEVLLGDRDVPVVVLTQSTETLEPVLPPKKVRAIVGDEAGILYVPGDYLLRRLRATLGHALAVSRGAARIFWPELAVESDGSDHPLIPVLEGESEEDALAEFARQFDLSRPKVRREIRLIEDLRSNLQDERDAAAKDARSIAERLRDANIERHAATVRAERHEHGLNAAGRLMAEDCEEALYLLIARQWLRAFLPVDRRAHPLGAHILLPEFVAALQRHPEIQHERVAWTCAMVACGYAERLPGVAPQRIARAAAASHSCSEDEAETWSCRLGQDGLGDGYGLIYRLCADGTVEFAEIEYRF